MVSNSWKKIEEIFQIIRRDISHILNLILSIKSTCDGSKHFSSGTIAYAKLLKVNVRQSQQSNQINL